MLGKKISVRKDATRRSAPYELIERIRRHFVGRVMTLAAATAFAATLALVLLPLTTRQLELSDYGTYGLLVSIVALVGAATDGGASLLVPAHYGLASAAERARLFLAWLYSPALAQASLDYCCLSYGRGNTALSRVR